MIKRPGDQWAAAGGDPESVGQARRHRAAKNALMRRFLGQGVLGQSRNDNQDDWDIEDLPLRGRIRVTTKKHQTHIVAAQRWVHGQRSRVHWGALAYPRWGSHAGDLMILIPANEFAVILGQLDQLIRQQRKEET